MTARSRLTSLLASLLCTLACGLAIAGPASAATATLRPGDRGPAVLALQQRLSGSGYWLGTPDGRYGELTRQAVMAVQGADGQRRDGIAGPRTVSALDRTVLPTVSVRTGHVVEIDRAAGTLTVADDGRVSVVLHTSTGTFRSYRSPSGRTEIADTPAGSFSVYRAVDGVRVAELGRLYRPRYFDPRQGIAVHGAADVPAYPASHGCARVTDAAMDMIWAKNLMPSGSPVVVR